MGIQRVVPLVQAACPVDVRIRSRVRKACQRCQLKKSKCDGSNQCGRCKADNTICVFGEGRKFHNIVHPKGYVEVLERQQAQLVYGLQELYRRIQDGQGWVGDALEETNHGYPLTHDILQRLGALKQQGRALGDAFEDDLKMIPQPQVSAGSMKREPYSDATSEAVSASVFDHISQRAPSATNPSVSNQFPPVPPHQIPCHYTKIAAAWTKPLTYPQTCSNYSAMDPAFLLPQTWDPSAAALDDSKETINRFESPTSFNTMSPWIDQSLLVLGFVNPSMPMLDLFEEGDF